MNYCTKRGSYYQQAGTCNCFAPQNRPASPPTPYTVPSPSVVPFPQVVPFTPTVTGGSGWYEAAFPLVTMTAGKS